MRKHRVALMFTALLCAALAVPALASTSASTQEDTSWTSTARPATPQHTMLLSSADLAPLGTFFADVQHAQEVTALNQLAAAAQQQRQQQAERAAMATTSSSSTGSSGAMSPSAPGTDLLLTEAPAYVVSAFHCIAYDHESGGNPTAVNPTSGDGGLYQFAVGTWLGNGGGQFAPRAELAPVWAQDTVAFWTWQHDGFQPWTGDDSCWS